MQQGSIQQIWKRVLSELQVQVTPATYNTMMAQVNLESVNEGIATLSCQNVFLQQQIESRYYNLIKNVLERQMQSSLSLVFEVRSRVVDTRVDDLPLFTIDRPEAVKADVVVPDHVIRRARLVEDYTFDTFAVGSTNQMAFAAAEAVAQNPGKAYNPLFIWGGVGVGKTHLMQAVAHVLLGKNPNLKVICCPGEEFTNEIVDAIRTKKTMAFKERYRTMDLLLLDDVQFLAGKDTAQEEFFHTFNAIQRSGGQIVLTSDRPPSEIPKLEDRLRSRFEAGLIVDVGNPDFELRTAIVLIKSSQAGIELDMETAQMIAEAYESAREMEGFLKQLSLAKFGPLADGNSAEVVRKLMGKHQMDLRMKKGVRPTDILRVTADAFGVKISDLKGKRRHSKVVRPRQVAMYLIYDELNEPYEGIGELFGGRDHTTVMHSVRKTEENMQEDSGLREKIMWIKQTLS